MTLHRGQKVECISHNWTFWKWLRWVMRPTRAGLPEFGRVYTVANVYGYRDLVMLELVELPAPFEHGWLPGFNSLCFRPVVERKTDTGFAILEEIRKRESDGAPAPRVPAHSDP